MYPAGIKDWNTIKKKIRRKASRLKVICKGQKNHTWHRNVCESWPITAKNNTSNRDQSIRTYGKPLATVQKHYVQ